MIIKDAYRDFKRAAKYIRLKIGKLVFDRPLKKSTGDFSVDYVKKILILRYDNKIGDMLINSIMFREIKRKIPSCIIAVVCAKTNYQIIKSNPYIDKIYFYPRKEKNKILKLADDIAKDSYDLLYDFSSELRNYELMFIQRCQATFNAGYRKENYRLFNLNITYQPQNEHISQLYINAIKLLNITPVNTEYDLTLKPEMIEKTRSSLEKITGFKICLNAFGSGSSNCFNRDRLQQLIKLLTNSFPLINFILIYPPDKKTDIHKLAHENPANNLYVADEAGLDETIAYISLCDLLITPDTCFVHICNALDKPLIAIYPSNSKEKDTWSPNFDKATVLLTRAEIYKNEKINIGEFSDMELIETIATYLKSCT